MIEFIECQEWGYKPRTVLNVEQSDLTIAFAMDFFSPGELLTKRSCQVQDKLYLPIDLSTSRDYDEYEMWHYERVKRIFEIIMKNGVKTINIAGNSLTTLLKYGFNSQEDVDRCIATYLERVFDCKLGESFGITRIRSGGQSGVDESGLKAAVKLGIPALCLVPKNWMFRDENGVDIKDEKRFKARFL